MRPPYSIFCLSILVSLFVSCAAVPEKTHTIPKDFQPVPGETSANLLLQADTCKAIGHWELPRGGSRSPKIVDTKKVTLKNPLVEKLRQIHQEDLVEELWIVDRNGKLVEYEVAYFPDSQGRTFIFTNTDSKIEKK